MVYFISGSRLQQACNALQLLLRSLPTGSLFSMLLLFVLCCCSNVILIIVKLIITRDVSSCISFFLALRYSIIWFAAWELVYLLCGCACAWFSYHFYILPFAQTLWVLARVMRSCSHAAPNTQRSPFASPAITCFPWRSAKHNVRVVVSSCACFFCCHYHAYVYFYFPNICIDDFLHQADICLFCLFLFTTGGFGRHWHLASAAWHSECAHFTITR